MALPDFLVIGAPKAGTTALHVALAGHPELFMSPIKEPKFFLTDGPPPSGGGPGDAATYREHVWRRPDYEALFAGAPPGALRGESTPFYLHDRLAHRRIRTLIPGARLIVILRDPVERAHSNWAHLRSAGLEPIGDFVAACAAQDRRAAAGWAAFWHYIALGRYGEQLDHLYMVFPREPALIVSHGAVADAPTQSLERICAFLRAAAGPVTEVPEQHQPPHPRRAAQHPLLSPAPRAAGAAGPPAKPAANGAPMPTGSQYFKLDPFTIPVMSHTAVVRHLPFIVTLELKNDSMRAHVQSRLPILRHALNTALLQLVGVERADGTLPPIAAIKSRMLDVTREVTGPDTVRALLMESVYERRLR